MKPYSAITSLVQSLFSDVPKLILIRKAKGKLGKEKKD